MFAHSLTTSRHAKRTGFTLIELAIVLAVTGVLIVGLYRLLASGNSQVKDSSVATQQTQLISAVKAFLATTNGSAYMAAKGTGAGGNFNLPLPNTNTSNAACKASTNYTTPAPPDANITAYMPFFCDYLPPGFSSATTNSYGQAYSVQVLSSPFAAPAAAPSTYSFMIVTTGGDVISDGDGGRISSMIGSDGGFLYSNGLCGAAGTWACGSYGAWTANIVTAYGFAAAATGGYVASRTYVSPESGNAPWLARQLIPGDTPAAPATPNYNTMQTPLSFGGQQVYFAGNTTITPPYVPAVPTGALNVQGGNINLQNGSLLDLANSTGWAVRLSVPSAPAGSYLGGATANNMLYLNTNCSADKTTAAVWTLHYTDSPPAAVADSVSNINTGGNDCKLALYAKGDGNFLGLLQATSLFSGTFIYQASDARLKYGIQPIAHALDAVAEMKPVSFKLKSNGQKSLGFIAQDMEKIYPELVMNSGNGKAMKAINYNGLVAPLVEAVQELKQQNDDLRNQLKSQALRQEQLEQKLKDKFQ